MFGWEFPPFNSGGLGVACLGLTRALTSRGMDVTFVMPKKLPVESAFAKILFADSVEYSVEEISGKSIRTIGISSTITPYTSRSGKVTLSNGTVVDANIYGEDLLGQVLRYSLQAGEIAKSEECDVIYAHDWLSFGAGIEAKRITGRPLIAHVHATEVDRCGGIDGVNPVVFELEKLGMQTADRVIAVSQLTKDIIVKYYGIDPNKIVVVHNGIDETTMPKALPGIASLRALKASGYSIVLFLGRITLQKGPDYFLKAAARVLQQNKKVIFVISGSGDMDRSVMEMSAALGIGQNVLFTGFLQGDDRTMAYAVADLFVMPSVSEPFGITPLEAMRLGTPVLISKQSGVSEVVFHALKVDFWDTDEMANKILAVIEHPMLHATLSDYAQNEALSITWDRAAQNVDRIIREVSESGVQ
ncbi:MAG: glycosyl transferase group 1 [Candidatus Kaiserbacteria bacterium]|nr:glycosyl transferase group 1 [Candidatus Kaiserbacteria bacterium]